MKLTDSNPRWRQVREATEREARSMVWWIGIWDDVPPVYGVPGDTMLRISVELHRAWFDRSHALHDAAVEIVHAHVDEEVRNDH